MTRIRGITGVALVLALAATLIASGCRQGRRETKPPSGGRALTAADVPVKPGLSKAFLSNDPRVNPFVPVEFDFEGPWDFSEGPIDTLIVARTVKVRDAFDGISFPKATVAQLMAVKGQEATATYGFFSENSTVYLTYGQASKVKGTNIFGRPETVLRFPLKVGDSWTDQVTLRSTPPSRMDVAHKVVGQNTVKVPAGMFKDAVMVQIKRTLTQSDGTTSSSTAYEWYAPGVGIVAAIAGRKDEPEALFREAGFFERLKNYTK